MTIRTNLGSVPILQKTKKRILKELQNGELHGYGIARRLNLPVTGIYQHLKDLSEDRLIVSTVKGRRIMYSLTKKGESLLELIDSDR